jgi:hypothetical protein
MASAVSPLPEFFSPNGRELGFPVPDSLVAEGDPALEEHLAKIAQGQAIARSLQYHQSDDVAQVLRPVQQTGAALVELLATLAAARPAVALGGAVLPLGGSSRAATDAFIPRVQASRY